MIHTVFMPKKKTIKLKLIKVVPDVDLPLLSGSVLTELKEISRKPQNVFSLVKKAFTQVK